MKLFACYLDFSNNISASLSLRVLSFCSLSSAPYNLTLKAIVKSVFSLSQFILELFLLATSIGLLQSPPTFISCLPGEDAKIQLKLPALLSSRKGLPVQWSWL